MKVAIGMTLHNNVAFLPEALESLLAQTDPDFRLLMLDDASTDATPEVAARYASRDPRVTYVRQPQRQGMIATWRRAFQLACADGDVAYFAWASDHDRWDPDWLRTLLDCLEQHPEVVLAYPFSRRMDAAGTLVDKPLRMFETAGLSDVRQRWARLCRHGIGAGDMVYGLMRTSAMTAAGVFRDVLRPDRLLIAELSLRGEIRQVPEVLWFRRQFGGSSVERQGVTLFGGHPAPPSIVLPPSVQHARALYQRYARQRDPELDIRRADMRGMIGRYLITYSVRHFRKSALRHRWGLAVEGLFWLRKRLVRAYHVTVYRLLVSTKAMRGRARRVLRRWLFNVLVFTRRIGFRQ